MKQLCITVATCVTLVVGTIAATAPPLHLIHVVADDLGYNDVSWHNPVMHTPNLAKLQSQGVHLAGMHTWKACAPSRGSIMSGRYPFHFGFYDNQDANAYGLATNFSTVPELLKAKGNYSTHMVGKWHLGFRSEALTPTRRGFDTFLGYYQHGEDYYSKLFNTACGSNGYDFNNASAGDAGASVWPQQAQVGDKGEYSAMVFTREAQRLIRRHAATRGANAPFYGYFPFQNVHAPVEVPARFEALYDGVIADPHRKTFAGMVSALDEAVGNITQTLKEEGMWDNTLLLFNSDNGGPMGSANNFPLRGGKFTYWDGGVRIQAFISTPRTDVIPATRAGGTWSGLAHTVDVMPTFLAAAGLSFDPAKDSYHGDEDIPFDGRNLLPAIQANGTSPRSEVVHMIDNEFNQAVCNESTGVGGQNHCGAGITMGEFKLLVGYPGDDGWPEPPSSSWGRVQNDTCAASSFLNDTCLHTGIGPLSNTTGVKDPAACCALCTKDERCGSWSLKGTGGGKESTGTCFLKVVNTKHDSKTVKGCISGIVRAPPSPAPACDTKTGFGCPCNPPSRGCLFRLSDDPNEHKDLANDPAFAEDFERLMARLRAVSLTGVVAARAMLGKRQTNADAKATCLKVNETSFFEPYAAHHPYYPYPAAN